MEQILTDTLNEILIKTEKKKIQSLGKKLLKKCSFKSKNDLAALSELGYWLYVYGCNASYT